MTTVDVRTPMAAAAAVLLGALALTPVLGSEIWLGPVIVAVVAVLLAGLALRAAGGALEARLFRDRPAPGLLAAAGTVLVPAGQLFALACWLTVRFASEGALGGVVPTRTSLEGLGAVLADGADEIREQVAPAIPVPALMALVTVFVGLVAVLVDLVAVAGRQAALAGLGLLALFCVPVFTLSGGIGVLALVAPAAGFALLLWADQSRRVRADSHARGTGAGGAARIGLAALLVGVLGGGLLPILAEGALAGGGGGEGSTGTSLNPMTTMVGQLALPDPVDLLEMKVSVDDPGYLRAVTLDHYDPEAGWSLGALDPRLPLDAHLPTRDPGEASRPVTATIKALGHDDRFLPLPVAPEKVRVDGGTLGWAYDHDSGTAVGDHVTTRHRTYEVTAAEPRPPVELLEAAHPLSEGQFTKRYAAPPTLDPRVTDQVAQLVDGAESDYARVRRILDFFTDPANGFHYSLSTQPGTSGDDLVDFLTEKRGYCEQYAGAMAVMVRAAGIPARVALGYTTGTKQEDGSRLITTDDAHAWVEVYFVGAGWVPFDPTPIEASRRAELPWAPRVTADRPETSAELPAPAAEVPPAELPIPEDLTGGADLGATDPAASGMPPWLIGAGVALLVAVAGALPAALRLLQRRRRLADGSATALWDELTATVDDLGLHRDPAWTPREAGRAFAESAADPQAFGRLARAEERASYGPATGVREDGLADALRTARRELRGAVGRRARLRATFWPESLFAVLRGVAAGWVLWWRALPLPWGRGARRA